MGSKVPVALKPYTLESVTPAPRSIASLEPVLGSKKRIETTGPPVRPSTRKGKPAYSVTFAGKAVIDGTQTYALSLVPLRDPKVNRLRKLWVGVNDYPPRKALVAGNFTIVPLVDVPWTIRFSVVNGVPLIAAEKAEQTLFMPHRHVVRDVSIAFEDVHPSDESFAHRGPVLELSPTDATLVEPRRSL